MCTVSWTYTPDGYELYCNRDEKKTRSKAKAPTVRSSEGVAYVAPIDTHSGGTWIAVNEYGIALCLLNGPADARSYPSSRGRVIPAAIAARDRDEAVARLHTLQLSTYAPFTLAVLSPNAAARVIRTFGESARSDMPLVSSSFDLATVDAMRRRAFAAAASLADLHASHDNGPSAYSTCMHRPDAETVSFSHIVVTPNDIRFSYTPHAPCIPSSSSHSLHSLARTSPALQPAR
jgi:Transport and Golgi organisation 2